MTQLKLTGYADLLRRFLVVMLVALWFGGFTFYSSVVIHTGHRVFGSQREVGFLTQQVTNWLNLIGIVTLLVLAWNVSAAWGNAKPLIRRGLLITWLVMVAVEITLFLLHPHLDALLNPATHAVASRRDFRSLHLWYMNLSTLQWSATILHVWLSLLAWRNRDVTLPSAPPVAPLPN